MTVFLLKRRLCAKGSLESLIYAHAAERLKIKQKMYESGPAMLLFILFGNHR
jgi:hypothetical protein